MKSYISLVLVILCTASSLTSATQWSSSLRGFVLLASGLGGFWCSRIILNNTTAQKAFAYMCVGLLVSVLALSCWAFFTKGDVGDFLYSNPHPLVNMIFLLSFAPLSLVAMRKPFFTALVAVLLLGFAYAVLYFCGVSHRFRSHHFSAAFVHGGRPGAGEVIPHGHHDGRIVVDGVLLNIKLHRTRFEKELFKHPLPRRADGAVSILVARREKTPFPGNWATVPTGTNIFRTIGYGTLP